MAVKRCLSMSHTQITSLLLGFILIFQRASSSQFHGIPPWYCPGWNFTRSEHDIVSAQPSPYAYSARLIRDSTVSCDVTERYTPSSFPDFARTTGQERTPRD